MKNAYPISNCLSFYSTTTFPNLIGLQDILSVGHGIAKTDQILKVYSSATSVKFDCYQHFEELLCYFFVPKCDSTSNQMIPACKESCQDVMKGCLEYFSLLIPLLSIIDRAEFTKQISDIDLDNLLLNYNNIVANCDYLPSRHGSIQCFYKPVTCKSAPKITNAVIIDKTANTNETHYPLHSQIEYSCQDDQVQMEGNNTVTCLYSGQWSEPPRCTSKSYSGTSPLYIVMHTLIIPFIIIAVLGILVKCRCRRDLATLTRVKTFDAFVCYAYEGNDKKFAEEILKVAFEEMQDPPFKLCLYRRDFKATWDIMWNIRNAITNSNSAIIIMSQDNVNSLWCKEEFEQCYVENMKDPAFKLFVIMMQPADSLENLSEYMKSFFVHKTYLEKDYPKLIKKIAEYLTHVKQPKQTKKCRAGNIEIFKHEEESIEMEELL